MLKTYTISCNGISRNYAVYIPNKLRTTKCLFYFHGGGQGSYDGALKQTKLGALAENKGILLVLLQGNSPLNIPNGRTWNGGNCCGYAVQNKIDDVAFAKAVVDLIKTEYNITKFFACGISNGAILTHRIAKETDVFTAVGFISGGLGFDPKIYSLGKPIPIFGCHGSDDRHYLYNGGAGPDSETKVNFYSIPETINYWKRNNKVKDIPKQTDYQVNTPLIGYSKYEYTGGWLSFGAKPITFYYLIGGGHTWPSGVDLSGGNNGPVHTLDFNNVMWNFFDQF